MSEKRELFVAEPTSDTNLESIPISNAKQIPKVSDDTDIKLRHNLDPTPKHEKFCKIFENFLLSKNIFLAGIASLLEFEYGK